MYDGPEDRTLEAVVGACNEALRLGHDYMATEHLLLGLLNDADGVAARALRSPGVGWNDYLAHVEAFVWFGEGDTSSLPLTPLAQEALGLAVVEASETGVDLAHPEHLLLGLIRVRQSIAVRVLSKMSVSLVGVRREVRRVLRGEGQDIGGT